MCIFKWPGLYIELHCCTTEIEGFFLLLHLASWLVVFVWETKWPAVIFFAKTNVVSYRRASISARFAGLKNLLEGANHTWARGRPSGGGDLTIFFRGGGRSGFWAFREGKIWPWGGGGERRGKLFFQPPSAAKIFEFLFKKQQILSIFSLLAFFFIKGGALFWTPGVGWGYFSPFQPPCPRMAPTHVKKTRHQNKKKSK